MRTFFKKILKIILGLSIILLIVSISLKEITNGAMTAVFAKININDKIINVIVSNFPEIDSNTLESIKDNLNNNNEINEISDIYLDSLLYDIKNNTVSNINVKETIDTIINKNINQIPLTYQNIIRTRINDIDFQDLYVQLLEYVKSKTTTEILSIIGIIEMIIDFKIVSLLIVLIVLSIILITILSKPIIEILYDIGITLLVIGGIMIVVLFIAKSILSYILAMISTSINPLSLLTIASFGSLITGFILIDIYDKLSDKSKERIKDN